MISYLLEHANPSILYPIKKEIFHNINEEEEKKLQDSILSEKIIQSIIACQKENGWLGNGYHGSNKNAGQFENMETGVKYLAEKGVKKDNDVLRKAMATYKLNDRSMFLSVCAEKAANNKYMVSYSLIFQEIICLIVYN